MRSFERYLNRRKIKDPVAYFTLKGITSNEELDEWCTNHGIQTPEVNVFEQQGTQAKSAKQKSQASGEKQNWHVPAAERPLKKTTKKRSTTKKKATK